MSNKTKIIIGIIAVAVIIVVGYLIYKNQNKPVANEPIKIGAILPLTGNQAAYGEGIKEGLELALEEINKDSSRKIEIIYEDNMGDIKNAVSAAQKLVNIDKAVVLISGPSQHSVAIAPFAEENKVVLYTMASQASKLDTAGEYIFKNDDNYFSLGIRAAKLVFDSGFRTAGIIFAKYNDAIIDAENAFRQEFEKLGGAIVTSEGFHKDEMDFRSILTKIAVKNPQAIFVNGLQKDSALILKQISELKLKQKIFGNAAIEDPAVLTVGEAANGVIFPTFQGVPSAQFIEKVKNKFDHYPLRWSIEAYDGLKIIEQALSKIPKQQEITREIFKEKLQEIKSYQGESGLINFDENGNAHRQLLIKTVKNGQFVPLEN